MNKSLGFSSANNALSSSPLAYMASIRYSSIRACIGLAIAYSLGYLHQASILTKKTDGLVGGDINLLGGDHDLSFHHNRTVLPSEGRHNNQVAFGHHKNDPELALNIKLVICAIARDEAPYLSEWIEHHKLIGFDTILLYNDHSTDDTQCVLDAYAKQDFVVRVPEDIGSKYMKDLSSVHKGQITDDPQQAIFEACRRYLVDEEKKNGEVGATWMLTNDVDEFVWFDKDKYENMKTALSSMLSAIWIEKPGVKSIRLPNCLFGSSGEDTYAPGLVMQRFIHRDKNKLDKYKAFSRVSSVAGFKRPEEHFVDGQVLSGARDIVSYFHLVHYKTKSRREFYKRVCNSRYAFKYYMPKSPAWFFDNLEAIFKTRDVRMISFAKDLDSNMSRIAASCATTNANEQTYCHNALMEMKNEDGFLNLVSRNLAQASFKPLVFGVGMGTTATHAMFDATCKLRLRSVHFLIYCGYGDEPNVPLPGILAHRKVIRAYKALVHCISTFRQGGSRDCPSVKQTIEIMQKHIDAVISSKDVGAIHDTPYPEFADYVIEATERIRGIKPIVLLSKRSPGDWAQSRKMHDDLICKLQMANVDDSLEQHIGPNMFWCLQTAMAKGMEANSILDIFDLVKFIDGDELYHSLSGGISSYQDHMKGKVQYQVNLFEFEQKLNSSQLAEDIDTTTGLSKVVSVEGDYFVPESFFRRHQFPLTDHPKRKKCMQNFREAFKSGRHCDKLVLFLHFHEAGGTSIIEYLRSYGLWFNLRTNSNPIRFEDIQAGDDIDFPIDHRFGHLRVHSSSETSESRASDSNFWTSLYDRGLDFVSLEYNFVEPKIAANMSSSVHKVTQLRKPWDRFRSTFERELQLKCQSKKERSAKELCFSKNMDHTGLMEVTRQKEWPGILAPNYYVRMLNGIADTSSDIELTREHLETAKKVLDSFDEVLILEDDESSNLRRLRDIFGDLVRKRALRMPKLSNNGLKDEPMYGLLGAQIEEMRAKFEDQNQLDNELYGFALQRKVKQFQLVETGKQRKVKQSQLVKKGKQRKVKEFQLVETGNIIECNISPSQYSLQSLTKVSHKSRKDQSMIHIHGWPHTGTGYLRQTIHKYLNSIKPGFSVVQDSLLNGGHHVPEDEGQHLQSIYPTLYHRRAVNGGSSGRPVEMWMKDYGKLLYLADTCELNATTNTENTVGEILFNQWSGYWDVISSDFLIQKTPTLDVMFLENVKVMPTLHVIIIRHPMSFMYTKQEKTTNWRPHNWLDSWAHVLGALAEGKVEWFAVVTYESLVEYYDQVVRELMEVVRSGSSRFGHGEVANEFDRDSASDEGTGQHHASVGHRRLHLHGAKSRTTYLKPSSEILNSWNRCLNISHCRATLDGLASDILPHFGYSSETNPPEKVTVSKEYGHVLFSSEGAALNELRRQQQDADNGNNTLGQHPPSSLIKSMQRLLSSEQHRQHNNNHRWRQQGSKTKPINGHIILSCHDRDMAINDSASQRRLKATAGKKKQGGGKEKDASVMEELVTIPEFYKKSNRCAHSFKDQVTFFHVGKAGGGTISNELRNNRIFLSRSHPKPSSSRIYALKNGPSKTLIVNVRDPIDRFISAFRWRLALLCKPDDGRQRHTNRMGATHHPHEVCSTGVREEKMLRETYNSDPNALAEALCEDSPLHEDALEDYKTLGHSLTLVEWLDFLVNPKKVKDVKENGIENFIVIPLEKRKQEGNNSNIIEGNENQSSSLFEQHIQQLVLHLISTRYGTQLAKEILNLTPQEDVRSSHKEKLEHSSVRFYNTTATIASASATTTTDNSDKEREQQQQTQQSPPAFLSPLGECCLARHLHQDYRLIRTMLGDTKSISAATAKRKKKMKSAEGPSTIALEPLLDAHPVLQKACTWGSKEQQMLCRSDLQSMLLRRAQYLDLSLGSCTEVVGN